MTVRVADRCTACGACVITCPTAALRPAPRRPALDAGRCTDCLACLEVCPVDAIHPDIPDPVHPIEAESYRIMAERVDLTAWPDGARELVARMVHATADLSFATSARVGAGAVAALVAALRAGAPVVCDARMVAAGAPSVPHLTCLLDEVAAAPPGGTRAAAAVRLAVARHPEGAVWVVGNAPTALTELLDAHAEHRVAPRAVVGLPVGFVGAAAAKARLWESPLAPLCVTNTGERGGSPVAAAVLNAAHRLARAGWAPLPPS